MPNHLEAALQEILSSADVRINGSRPWDIAIHNSNFYSRVFRQGSIGLGDSNMDAWWDCAQLDEFFSRILEAKIDSRAARNRRSLWLFLKSLIFNRQTKSRSGKVGKEHYDLGNEVF